jgi:glycine betaine/proline transport system permease protein
MTVVADIIQDHAIPLDQWVANFVAWVTTTFAGFFNFLTNIISSFVSAFDTVLDTLPPLAMIVIFVVIALLAANWKVALFTAFSFLLIDSLLLWDPAMLTVALVLSSAVVALVLGIPTGILAAQFRVVEAIVGPILDFMQTMPPFVYLIPGVILFGIGNVPALVVTVIFAAPPAIRLTLLGIQQVSKETVEASEAFGATPWQTLIKVELPQAMPTIMAGVNQVIMLSLSMVVIAALIGAGGLGENVQRALSQLDTGHGFTAGLGIVLIAIVLDRITRHAGQGDLRRNVTWMLSRVQRIAASQQAVPAPAGQLKWNLRRRKPSV